MQRRLWDQGTFHLASRSSSILVHYSVPFEWVTRVPSRDMGSRPLPTLCPLPTGLCCSHFLCVLPHWWMPEQAYPHNIDLFLAQMVAPLKWSLS